MRQAHTQTQAIPAPASTNSCNEARLNKNSMSNANHSVKPVNPLPYPGLSRQKQVSDNIFGIGQPSFTYTRQQPTTIMGFFQEEGVAA